MNKKRNIFMYSRSTPILQKTIKKERKKVAFIPFNEFNCQIHTNAGKTNSLINHVQFWIEMFHLAFKIFSTNHI